MLKISDYNETPSISDEIHKSIFSPEKELNPFLLNTDHLFKKPISSPMDHEVQVMNMIARSKTFFSFGSGERKVFYPAYKALVGINHEKWLSRIHVENEIWEAQFKVPQKLDTICIEWLNPPKYLKLWFKLDEETEFIPITELIEKQKAVNEDGKNPSPESVSDTDCFVFNKPLYAKKLRISMSHPLKSNCFSIL